MPEQRPFKTSRRTVLVGGASLAGIASLPTWAMAEEVRPTASIDLRKCGQHHTEAPHEICHHQRRR
jgi:hypothetical protein